MKATMLTNPVLDFSSFAIKSAAEFEVLEHLNSANHVDDNGYPELVEFESDDPEGPSRMCYQPEVIHRLALEGLLEVFECDQRDECWKVLNASGQMSATIIGVALNADWKKRHGQITERRLSFKITDLGKSALLDLENRCQIPSSGKIREFLMEHYDGEHDSPTRLKKSKADYGDAYKANELRPALRKSGLIAVVAGRGGGSYLTSFGSLVVRRMRSDK